MPSDASRVVGPPVAGWAPPLAGRRSARNGRPALAVVTPFPNTKACDVTDLVEHHLPLVAILVSERLQHVPTHVRRDELMSAGMIALVLSAGAYDPKRGVPFRKFAAFRIRGALIDELRSMDWASRSVRSRAREVETARSELTGVLAHPPAVDEIADALGISVRQLDAVYSDLARGTVLSLQSCSVDAMPGSPRSDLDSPESLILHRERLGYLHDAVAALPERLRFVVVAHFFEQRKMIDIALEISVTQSRVSQLCTEAITLIRDGMDSQLNPDAQRSLSCGGRAGAVRHAYFQAVADRSTVAGRLDMTTSQGEMRRDIYPEHVPPTEKSRIA